MRFIAEGTDKKLDVTELVKMMYDALVNSTDWGSEFLDTESKGAVLAIGELIGAKTPECGREYSEARSAGFNEPAPSCTTPYEPGLRLDAWAAEYNGWRDRQNSAIAKWYKEVAAQKIAELQEVE